MSEPKVVHEWVTGDTRFAVVEKEWEDLRPEDPEAYCEYARKMCHTLRVVDACGYWLDCGSVDFKASEELARLAARVERWKEAASEATKSRLILAARVQELERQIITAINGLEQYKEMVLERDAENKRLREALGEYGHHKPRCKLDPCDCGILAALKEKP